MTGDWLKYEAKHPSRGKKAHFFPDEDARRWNADVGRYVQPDPRWSICGHAMRERALDAELSVTSRRGNASRS